MDETNYYLFIVGKQMDDEGADIASKAIFGKLIATGSWYLADYTAFRRDYKPGDRIVFYLAGRGSRYFVGTAVVAGAVVEVGKANRGILCDFGLYGYKYELPLSDIVVWDNPKPIKPMVPDLAFIKDKRYYGLHLRQGAARISESDYRLIVEC